MALISYLYVLEEATCTRGGLVIALISYLYVFWLFYVRVP